MLKLASSSPPCSPRPRSLAARPPPTRPCPCTPRTAPAAGAKPFEALSSADTGVTVPNVFNDPRMWGDRFRELTLGAVETGIAVADFDRDGLPDIFAVSKNGPCALYRQVAPFKFLDIAARRGRGLRRGRLEQHRRHRRRHQPGRLARHLRLPLRRAESAFRQQRRRHLHRTRQGIRPRYQGRLRPRRLCRLRSRRLHRLLPRHQHPRFFQSPAGPSRTTCFTTTATVTSPMSPPRPASGA